MVGIIGHKEENQALANGTLKHQHTGVPPINSSDTGLSTICSMLGVPSIANDADKVPW